MKTIVKLIAVITAVFILAAFISYRVITNYYNREEGMRTVVMNRITSDVEDRLEEEMDWFRANSGFKAPSGKENA